MNSEEAANIMKKVGKEIQQMSTPTQIAIGSASGLATGYVFSRLGKMAALSIGSALILLQVANHSGFIEVKWKKSTKIDDLKQKAIAAAEEVGLTQNQKNNKLEKIGRQLKSFFRKNATFGVSFGGGLLIGLSF